MKEIREIEPLVKENETDEINPEGEFEITNPEELANDEQMKLNFENPETGDKA